MLNIRQLGLIIFFRSASKDGKSLAEEELKVFKLLERAVLVSIFHLRPIHLLDVPKKKNGYIDTKVERDVCAFGIYPDLPRIEASAAGEFLGDIFSYFNGIYLLPLRISC